MRLRTLGGLALEGTGLTRPKPLLLLAFLALEGPRSRRELAELFFGELADPRDSLSTALRHLRARAPEAIRVEGRHLAASVACDAAALLELLDADRVEDARGLYRGPFLAGLDLALEVELEEWVFATRELLVRRLRRALLRRARRQRGAGSEAAEVLLREALALRAAPEPEPDDLALALPLLAGAEGSEAVAWRTLAAELGVAAAPLPAARAARPALPRELGPLVGREAETRSVLAWLRRPDGRLVTLCGLGGIGKSRLALRIATRLADGDPLARDGAAFVALESVADPSAVPAAIGAGLGAPSAAPLEPEDLAGLLTGRWLLVLDNVEHLVDVGAALLVRRLLDVCPELRLLVTSRRPLALAEERTVRLEGLPWRGGPDPLPAAARLFLERASRFRPEAVAEVDARGPLLEICRRLEGHPLALELAAGLVRALPLDEIAAVLAAPLAALPDGPRDAPERHRSARAVLEPTWSRLDERIRAQLRALSVFVGPFRHEDAARVAGASLPELTLLVDGSLLRAEGDARFAFHPLVRDFLRERSAEWPTEHAASRRRHTEAVRAVLGDARDRIAGGDRGGALTRLEAFLADVEAALERELEADPPVGVAMLRTLVVDCDLLTARGASARLVELLRRGAAAAETAGDAAAASTLHGKLGDLAREARGDPATAARHYDRALALARQAADPHRVIVLLSLLGVCRHLLADRSGDAALEEARALALARDDRSAYVHVLQNWSFVHSRRGDWAAARATCEEAIAEIRLLRAAPHADRAELDQELFFNLLNLGQAETRTTGGDGPLARFRAALELAEARDSHLWIGYALEEIGRHHHGAGRPAPARAALARALRHYHETGVRAVEEELEDFLRGAGLDTDADGPALARPERPGVAGAGPRGREEAVTDGHPTLDEDSEGRT